MQAKFAQYITADEITRPKQSARLVSFCHFDAKARVADHVVFYAKSLHALGADVVFVSNCETLAELERAKIRPYVSRIITRKNIGYDFACYFTGYEAGRNDGYEEIIFANDSVFGPFFPLARIFEKMQNFDMWGISDAYAGRYHIQSNFWVFKHMQKFLDAELAAFEFISEKNLVVGRYEEGITQRLMAGNYKLGVWCDNKELAAFEAISTDTVLRRLKGNIEAIAKEKINWARKIKGFFVPSIRRRNAQKINEHANLTGIFSGWYAMVKYFDGPFIKVSLLKRKDMEKYHEGEYIALLQTQYPDYDVRMIQEYLGKT